MRGGLHLFCNISSDSWFKNQCLFYLFKSNIPKVEKQTTENEPVAVTTSQSPVQTGTCLWSLVQSVEDQAHAGHTCPEQQRQTSELWYCVCVLVSLWATLGELGELGELAGLETRALIGCSLVGLPVL